MLTNSLFVIQKYIPQEPLIDLECKPFKVKNKRVMLPQYLSQKLAYYIGYLQGDGCIESNLKRVDFIDEHKSHLNFINYLTYDLFNVSGNIRERFPSLSKKAVYTLEIGSVDVHKFLRKVFSIPVGVKKDLSIPHQMYKNRELMVWYLRGLFDADGTLPKNAISVKQPFLDITLKDLAFIEEIQKVLQSFGIRTLKPYKRVAKSPHSDFISETWELRIRKRADMISFINEIGFFSENKANRIESLLKRLNAPVAQSGY